MQNAGTLYTEMNPNVQPDDLVTAYHVCHINKARLIQTNQTAGGVAVANAGVGAPTEKECIGQVMNEGMPGKGTAPRVVVEFGVGQRPSYHGASDYVVAVFNIRAKYLRQGSGTEQGWCAYPAAPVVWVRAEST